MLPSLSVDNNISFVLIYIITSLNKQQSSTKSHQTTLDQQQNDAYIHLRTRHKMQMRAVVHAIYVHSGAA